MRDFDHRLRELQLKYRDLHQNPNDEWLQNYTIQERSDLTNRRTNLLQYRDELLQDATKHDVVLGLLELPRDF